MDPIHFQALSRQAHNPHVTAQRKMGEPLVAQCAAVNFDSAEPFSTIYYSDKQRAK
jgi:hypothetical protein